MNTMDNIANLLNQELEQYKVMQSQVTKSCENAPEGYLQINMRNNKPQYYICNSKEGTETRKYIRKSERELAEKLAQKEYDKEVNQTLEEYVQWLQRTHDTMPKKDLQEIWRKRNPSRRSLIQPYIVTDEQYRQEWESVQYEGKSFKENTPEIYTEKGERVRSKSEKIIADKLNSMGIPYRYEYPLYLKGYGKIYPDFTLLNVRTRKEYYLEHFGMMDNPEYACKTVHKLEAYGKNGIFPGEKLLVTYETSDMICDMRVVQVLFEKFLI